MSNTIVTLAFLAFCAVLALGILWPAHQKGRDDDRASARIAQRQDAWEVEAQRIVDHDIIDPYTRVSTVRLPSPYLGFETMVFGGDLDEHSRRYDTEDEARAGHREAVEWLRGEILGPNPLLS